VGSSGLSVQTKDNKLGIDDDEVRFVLDQHTELYYYSASSLKQQSAGRHVAPLGHIILTQCTNNHISLKKEISNIRSTILNEGNYI
jgi:hypothetical protein